MVELLCVLEDEFRNISGVRVRPVFPAGTRRSPDLVQDYDPESNRIHQQSGVMVSAKNRDFYFPTEWLDESSRKSLHDQVSKVRERLGIE